MTPSTFTELTSPVGERDPVLCAMTWKVTWRDLTLGTSSGCGFRTEFQRDLENQGVLSRRGEGWQRGGRRE